MTRILALFAAVLALGVATNASARCDDDDDDDDDGRCQHFDGPFSSVVIPPPECTSPVGLCTHGILAGELPGTYDFTATTAAPDPNDPSTLILTGTSVVTTHKGVLYTDDVSVLHQTTPVTPSPFVTTANVQSGTRHWRHASGTFVATGSLILATGQATGTYTADLCKNRHHHGH